jgi:hypothetical protein
MVKTVPNSFQNPERISYYEFADGRKLEAEGEGVVGRVQRQPPLVAAIAVVQRHIASFNQLIKELFFIFIK